MPFFRKKREIPAGLWMKCPACGKMAFTKTVEESHRVCPECDHHMKVNGPLRVKQLLDDGGERLGEDLIPKDLLRFRSEGETYEDVLERSRIKSGVSEAATAARGTIEGIPVTLLAMDFSFRGGSMGVVVGERVAMAADDAYERQVPFILVATSGGARMQEGALSLMQMAKTSAAIARLKEAGLPYIVLLADPCTGGVSASFAALGDVTLAEPGALIGFAGPRVIQNTIKAKLPEGFQRSEFLLEKGYVDRIVHRSKLRDELATLLRYMHKPAAELATAAVGEADGGDASNESDES
ncbi:MAG: acetyl-CoA carboxylase, carboxyltransferase subunit beta [Planctomycetota bacterium]|nr:acetyl-CoA carboxylase, carboxyltransferase subunit beta [Planctomycetota bacterium]